MGRAINQVVTLLRRLKRDILLPVREQKAVTNVISRTIERKRHQEGSGGVYGSKDKGELGKGSWRKKDFSETYDIIRCCKGEKLANESQHCRPGREHRELSKVCPGSSLDIGNRPQSLL